MASHIERVRLHAPENAHQQRHTVSQSEETHVEDHILKAIQKNRTPTRKSRWS